MNASCVMVGGRRASKCAGVDSRDVGRSWSGMPVVDGIIDIGRLHFAFRLISSGV